MKGVIRLNGLVAGGVLLAMTTWADPVFLDQGADLFLEEIVPVRDQVVAVKYVNRVLQRPRSEWDAASFRIQSDDDPAYHEPQAPTRGAYWVRPERYTIRKPLNIKYTWCFLTLPSPLQPGATYTITAPGITWRRLDQTTGQPVPHVREEAPALSLTYRGDAHRSLALHVNQVGYLPTARKYGYLTHFAGYEDGTADTPRDVDFSDCTLFEVIDAASGTVMWTGTVAAACADGTPDPLSESRIWKLDFTDFTAPGHYRLRVPAVGVSFPFSICPAVYNQVFGVLMRGVYHQRCGAAKELPWTRHVDAVACHLDDARVPLTVEYERPALEFIPQQEGAVFDVTRGHHDAGDYGKYTLNGALFAYKILQAFEVYPERLRYDQSPLPYADNQIPDLIETVKWELDWLSAMQDPEDGAAHIIVKPDPTMSYEDGLAGAPSERFDKQRVLWWKDIHATAALGAVLARAARTPDFVAHYPEEAERYLDQAKRAWEFCMQYVYPDGTPYDIVGGHHYGIFLGAKDEYNWLAVELWLTTGDAKYHDYFLAHHDPEEAWQWSWWPLVNAAGAATRAYAYGPRTDHDPDMLARCRDGDWGVLGTARTVMAWQKDWTTRPSFALTAFRYGRWGWYFLSDIASYDLLLAASLVDEDEEEAFIQAALFNADQEFGNAADSQSTITGIGAKRPIDIVHQHARFDGIVEPIPGIPLGIHPAGFNRGTGDRGLMASHMVTDLPVAYRYVDCWNIEQEFTIDKIGAYLITYALLGDMEQQRGGFPTVNVTANGSKGPVKGAYPFTVQFQAEAQGANGKSIREYYWDLMNEDTFAGPVFTYTFTEPGRYVVVCTVTDESGWPAFAEIEVHVQQPASALPNQGEPWSVTPHTYGLWRLDGDLEDAVNGRPATLTGGAHFTDENLLWMTAPTGQAVRVDGPEDGLRIPITLPALDGDAIQAVVVDAIIQYQGDIPNGQGHSRMFMLHGRWDAQLGLHKDSWGGKSIQGVEAERLEKPRAVLDQRMLEVARPRPGWAHARLAVDHDRAQARLAINDELLTWPLGVRSGYDGDLHLYIGGFTGYIDEVRIQIRERTVTPDS